MKRRAAIAQYEATVVLVVISLSLASVVYEGLRREATLSPEPVFVNGETPIGGSPAIVRLGVNASSPTTISSFSLDGASSMAGVLAFNGTGFSTSSSLCGAGVTTFFSVLASQAGTLRVATDGRAWVSGTWGSAVAVTPGWQEVMIQGTSCSITLPDGQAVAARWSPSSSSTSSSSSSPSQSSLLSSIPAEGTLSGTTFTFYVPGGGSHRLLITSSGGLDDVAL